MAFGPAYPRVMRTLAWLLACLFLLVASPRTSAEEEPDAPSAAEKSPLDPEVLEWARGVVKGKLARDDLLEAPDFPELDWLNVARPLTMEDDLRGKVVILDFWCYCCINCIHVLPDLAYLEKKYADKPFAVVGVHSAKFENEKGIDNIREAVRRYEITHPVINDFAFTVWKSFGARSWPTFVVIAPDGRVVGRLGGEGHRDELDALTTALLELFEGKDLLNKTPLPTRLEAETRQAGALAYPGKVLVDGPQKRLFVADSNHNRILELGLDGAFRRAFGGGARGSQDGTAAEATFFRPQGMALLGNSLYVCDTENHKLRAIDLASGAVSTVAGTGRQFRGGAGTERRPGLHASLSSPWDLQPYQGDLLIAMAGTHQIWRYDPEAKTVQLYAGDPRGAELRRDADGLLDSAFAQPSGFATLGEWVYVADSESSAIVKLKADGPVATLAGGDPENPRNLFHFGDEDGAGPGKRFQHPLGLAMVGDTLYVADSYNHKIKSVNVKTGDVRSRFGTGLPGMSDAPAQFDEPGGLAALGSVLFVADTNNHAIRRIDTASGEVTTLDVSSVPLPQESARAAGQPDEWPEFPGTVTHRTLFPMPISAGSGRTLSFRLEIPKGWKLTEGAPSAARLEGPGFQQDVAIKEASLQFELPPLAVGERAFTARLLYYVCQDDGSCRVRSVLWEIDLHVQATGAARMAFTDRFDP